MFPFQIWLTKLTAALTSQIPGISLGVNVFLSIILRSYRFIFSPDGSLAGVETDHTETTTAVATIIIKPGKQISPQKVNKIICQADHVRFSCNWTDTDSLYQYLNINIDLFQPTSVTFTTWVVGWLKAFSPSDLRSHDCARDHWAPHLNLCFKQRLVYTAPHHVIYFSVTSARSCDTRLATTSYNSILEKLFLSRGSTEGEGGEVLVTRGKISFLGSTAPRLPPPSLAYSVPQTSWPKQREVSRVDLAVFIPARHPWLPLPPAVRFVFSQKIILFLIYDLRTDNWMIHWVNADIFSCCLFASSLIREVCLS